MDEAWHLTLSPGVDPARVVHLAMEAGVELRRFERVVPRLHEMFIRHAGTDAADDAGRPPVSPVAEAVR